jgi:hypothetical protein
MNSRLYPDGETMPYDKDLRDLLKATEAETRAHADEAARAKRSVARKDKPGTAPQSPPRKPQFGVEPKLAAPMESPPVDHSKPFGSDRG